MQINFLSILFNQFWSVADDIILLNRYADILKQNYIKKNTNNSHFYYFNNFLQIVIKALIIALYIHLTKCSTIDFFHVWIKKLD